MPPAVALAATPDLSSAAEPYLLRRAITRTITQPVMANAAAAPTKEANSPVSNIDRPRGHAAAP